jgi:hypothetical protein
VRHEARPVMQGSAAAGTPDYGGLVVRRADLLGTRVELGAGVHTQSARCKPSVWQGVARQTVSRLGVMRLEARQFRNVGDG